MWIMATPNTCCSYWNNCGTGSPWCDKPFTTDVTDVGGGQADYANATFHSYKPEQNHWDLKAANAYCATRHASKSLAWRQNYGWTAFCAPNGPSGQEACRKCLKILQHEQLLRCSLMNGNLQWLGYLSSTSVYGDCGGSLVDEDFPPCPTNDIAKSRLAAEQGWLNLGHSLGISTQVFRLGGIYGPGRSAVDTIVRQRPLSKGQKMRMSRQYTSRVHVEDICQVLKASICMPSSRRIYNVVDDDPAPREDVFAYAEKLIEKKWPGTVKRRTSLENEFPINMSTSSGEKRVSNARMKSELGLRLLHPSYRSGLGSIVDKMQKPFEHGPSCS